LLEELREDRALCCEDVPVAMHHARSGALVVAGVGFTTEGSGVIITVWQCNKLVPQP
jgi:hypothetical protein